MQTDYDIAVVGGGMVGASLACALAGKRCRVAVIEAVSPAADAQPSYDDRGLSLSLASQRILSALQVWPSLASKATPIRHIHVSDRGHFGFVRLHADDLDLPAMGYVVVARDLGTALTARLQEADNIDFLCPVRVRDVAVRPEHIELSLADNAAMPSLTCRLLVVADGARSRLREWLNIAVTEKDYGQTAIVANVTPERSHNNWAFERFTCSGPVALLPLPEDCCASVCTVASAEADAWMNLDDSAYLDRLQSRFGRRLGRLLRVGRRQSYPLIKLEPAVQVRGRALLLGNAAHSVHPNAAQGFNLGLRDAAGLAETLSKALPGSDLADPGLLNGYLDLRRRDQQQVIAFTDRLAGLFYNNDPARILARDTAMLLTDLVPALKHRFMRRAMGIAGHQPAMVRSGERFGY